MGIQRDDFVTIDLDQGTLHRSFMNRGIGEGDANGNRFGIRCIRGSEQVALNGYTVNGYFIRADNVTIILEGTASGNTAYVDLTQQCYAVEGNFTLAIKVTGAGATETMRIVDGTVVNTTSDAIVDPGGAVPDLAELLAVIGRAEDAAEAINDFIVTEELISGDDYRLIVDVDE